MDLIQRLPNNTPHRFYVACYRNTMGFYAIDRAGMGVHRCREETWSCIPGMFGFLAQNPNRV